MLAYHLNESTGIVELRPRGRLEARDFASLALTVDGYLEDHGKLRGVVVEVDHFPGWDDWDAISAHLRFVPFSEPVPTRRVVLAWRRSFTRYEAIAALRNAIYACQLDGVSRLSQ